LLLVIATLSCNLKHKDVSLNVKIETRLSFYFEIDISFSKLDKQYDQYTIFKGVIRRMSGNFQ